MSILSREIKSFKKKIPTAKLGRLGLNYVEFDLDDGKKQLVTYQHPITYHKNSEFHEIDSRIIDEEDVYAMRKSLYEVEFSKGDILEIKYKVNDKQVIFKPVYLQYINDVGNTEKISDFIGGGLPIIENNTICWQNVFGNGLHLKYTVGPTLLHKDVIIDNFENLPEPKINGEVRIEVVLELSGSFRIENYTHLDLNNIQTEEILVATTKHDNIIDGNMVFTLPRYKDSGVQVIPNVDNEYFETIGKRRIFKDGEKIYITTSVEYCWLKKALYPVFIDTDVDYQVGASGDDGTLKGATYYNSDDKLYFGLNNGAYGDTVFNSCMRFTGVAVPNAATIDSAKMQFYIVYNLGTQASVCHGIDEDNTATMTASPFGRTKTTASSDFSEGQWSNAATGAFRNTPSISTIVKEIVDRSGWSSGNAMGFLVENDGSPTTEDNYMGCYSYDQSGNVSGPKLYITYTAGGGGSDVKSVNGVAQADVKSINGIATANIKSVNGITW